MDLRYNSIVDRYIMRWTSGTTLLLTGTVYHKIDLWYNLAFDRYIIRWTSATTLLLTET